jgi:hypothetical protein
MIRLFFGVNSQSQAELSLDIPFFSNRDTRQARKKDIAFFDYGLMANTQNPSSAATKCTSVKPAAVSASGGPLFDCPE